LQYRAKIYLCLLCKQGNNEEEKNVKDGGARKSTKNQTRNYGKRYCSESAVKIDKKG
jgi:hypothetical protein